ncbi:hypothetical protein [Amycolatopsis tolypomycina]|uniref:hypothetical protein n=1 Tax=Amycolatopsis tolypomycina TaxID=208445 RepID=UPI0033AF91B5
MLERRRGKPDDAVLRRAMTGWAFNTVRRETDKPPAIEAALAWLESNTVNVSRLGDLTVLRGLLDQLTLKMDGAAAAAKTVYRKRAVVYNALEYAVERDLLLANRLPAVKWTAPKRGPGDRHMRRRQHHPGPAAAGRGGRPEGHAGSARLDGAGDRGTPLVRAAADRLLRHDVLLGAAARGSSDACATST